MRLCVLAVVTAAVPALAQVPGQEIPGPEVQAAPTQGAQLGSGASRSVSAAPSASPDALFGLRGTDSPVVITLDEAMRRGIERNWDLRIAREKVAQQQAQVRRAWALLLPQANLSGAYTYNCLLGASSVIDCGDQTLQLADPEQLDQQALLFGSLGEILEAAANVAQDPAEEAELRGRSEGLFEAEQSILDSKDDIRPIVVQPAQLLSGRFTITQPLFNARSLPLLWNANRAVDAVELAGSQAQRALGLAVARSYYSAFTAKKLVTIAAEQRDSAARHRDATKLRVELNTVTALALRRAELDVIRAEQSVRAAQAGLRLAVGALGSIIGEDTIFEVVEPAAQPAIEAELDVDALLERAIRTRADLRAQKIAVRIADNNKTDAWMMFLPSFNLTASAAATSNVGGFVNAPVTGALSVTASVPIYDGGTRYAALRENSSRLREELMKVHQLEERIAGQVRGNVDDIDLKKGAVALSREAAAVSRQAAEQANALLEVGAATPLDVSDANLAVFAADVELARAELDLEQARLGLSYVVGAFPQGSDAEPAAFKDAESERARKTLERVE